MSLRWKFISVIAGVADYLGLPDALDVARDRRLRARLGFCGKDVGIAQPVMIEGADQVFIGENVSIASFLHIWGQGGVTIGRGTMIASHVAITSITHDACAPVMRGTLIKSPVTIGDEVWIGAHAVIFPGVSIGDHAVVAAGAIVRHDVPAHTIVAGVPAVSVRDRLAMSRSSEPGIS